MSECRPCENPPHSAGGKILVSGGSTEVHEILTYLATGLSVSAILVGSLAAFSSGQIPRRRTSTIYRACRLVERVRRGGEDARVSLRGAQSRDRASL